MSILSKKELLESLSTLRGWRLVGKFIEKTYLFSSFFKALEFVNRLGKFSEEMKYHPEILLNFIRVRLRVSGPTRRRVTRNGIKLAEKAEQIFKELQK